MNKSHQTSPYSVWTAKRPAVHRSTLFGGLASRYVEQGQFDCLTCKRVKSDFERYAEIAK